MKIKIESPNLSILIESEDIPVSKSLFEFVEKLQKWVNEFNRNLNTEDNSCLH